MLILLCILYPSCVPSPHPLVSILLWLFPILISTSWPGLTAPLADGSHSPLTDPARPSQEVLRFNWLPVMFSGGAVGATWSFKTWYQPGFNQEATTTQES